MGTSFVKRILTGLALASLLLIVSVTMGETRSPRQEATGECQSCHAELQQEWEKSMHGQAATNRAFLQAWKEQDEDPACLSCHVTGYDPETGMREADGVACNACHNPVVDDHPNEIMPTQATSAACGTCHTETYAEWQTSQHGEESLNCINCHNPHTTSLKAEDELALCNSCHNQETHFYAFTAHAAKGLTCTDCHLRVSDEPMGGGHGQRLHTFEVDLASCNQCHGGEMHYPVQDAMGGSEQITEAVVPAAFEGQPEVERAEIAAEPAQQESNPFTHILAVVVGLGVGIIIAPALEGAYRRVRSR